MAKKKSEKPAPQKSFEENLRRLEEIVEALEAGNLSLDKSIEVYSEGVGLIDACRKSLAEAEQKIKKLTKGSSGQLSTKPFEPEETEADEAADSDDVPF